MTMASLAVVLGKKSAQLVVQSNPLRVSQAALRPMTILSKESAEEYKKLVCVRRRLRR